MTTDSLTDATTDAPTDAPDEAPGEAPGEAPDEAPEGVADASAPAAASDGRSRLRHLMPRTARARLVAAGVIGALVAGGGVLTLRPSGGLPDGVAFRIGDRNVSEDALEAKIKTLSALYAIQVPKDGRELADFKRTAAKAYAVSLVLDKAAADRRIVVSDAKARELLAAYVAQQFGKGPAAMPQFVAALGQLGTDQAAVLEEIKHQQVLRQLLDQVTAGVTVTDKQVAAEFAENKAKMVIPEQRAVRNIVVSTESAAAQIKRMLRQGMSFSALAAQYSMDAATRKSGGDLGTVAAADLDTGYAKAAFAAKVGVPFGPVNTKYGWNVGVVTRVLAAKPAKFAAVKADLKSQLTMRDKLDVWRAWLSGQLRAAHVRYADRFRPAQPNEAPTTPLGAPETTTTR